jgi:NAD(P)-dependent dehydrogenase (short-subunit alcohol dehydrogenase family)
MTNSLPLCAIVGAGPGNGRAFARRFADGGYRIALLARQPERLRELAADIPDALLHGCDVTRRDDVRNAAHRLEADHGCPQVLVYNAGSGVFGSVDDVDAEAFEEAWRTNAAGLLAWVQAVLPGMRADGGGRIIIIGATAAKRGGAEFTAFASAKHAQYGLAQSLARKLAPENIHISYVVIDGVIDTPRTREMLPDKTDNFFLKASDIAESVYQLAQQPPSARSFEIDLRPYGERW